MIYYSNKWGEKRKETIHFSSMFKHILFKSIYNVIASKKNGLLNCADHFIGEFYTRKWCIKSNPDIIYGKSDSRYLLNSFNLTKKDFNKIKKELLKHKIFKKVTVVANPLTVGFRDIICDGLTIRYELNKDIYKKATHRYNYITHNRSIINKINFSKKMIKEMLGPDYEVKIIVKKKKK